MVADLKPIPQDVTDSVLDIEFWRNFAPEFTISDKKDSAAISLSDQEINTHKEKLIADGYLHVENPGLNSPLDKMTALFSRMVEQGVPPVFAFVYDEFWHLNMQIRTIIGPLLDNTDYALLPDFWAWHVAPGQSGWAPHRDKGANSLFNDKRPKSLTVWIPLTQAYPLNGCMYCIPAGRDKGYGLKSPDGGNMLPGATLPDVRALPGNAGDVFVWTQQLFHWGSHSADKHHLPPRMSVAFEYQRLDVKAWNQPLLPSDVLPTFEQRLALIAKQVQQYTHMYKFGPDLIELAKKMEENCKLPESVHREDAA